MKIRFTLGICLWLGLVSPAMAQMSLEVAPIRAEHQIPAGVTETNVVQVRNAGTAPVRVRVSLQDWTLERQGDLKFSRAGSHPRSLAPWLELNPTDFQVAPGRTAEIRYTMMVPPTAPPGTYWVAVLVDGLPAQQGPPRPHQVTLHGRIAVMLYETVGPAPIQAQCQDLQVIPGRQLLKFILTLSNPGVSYFRPRRSQITLREQQGREVGRIEIPDAPVLPGSARDIIWTAPVALKPGTYQAEALLDLGRRELFQVKRTFSVGQ